MAKKKKSGKRGGKAIPVAPVAPIVIQGWPVLQALLQGNMTGAAQTAQTNFASTAAVGKTYVPALLGAVAHKGANRLGINRHVRKLTMGYLEI